VSQPGRAVRFYSYYPSGHDRYLNCPFLPQGLCAFKR